MSAFIVSKDHIDALITVALFGVTEVPAASGRWHGMYFGNPSMRVEVHNAKRIGEILACENRASVWARYPNEKVQKFMPYEYPFHKLPVALRGAVEALKLVQCYEYQSCEHEGWESSAAKRFCASLTSALISSLSGYDAAPWGI